MVDGPCVNHAEKAVNHVLWLTGLLGRWLTVGLITGECGLRNSDGWLDVLGRLFRTRSVMGRLWDDHFRDLGHPPKFYRVQDACFIGGSSIWWQIIVILEKNHWNILKRVRERIEAEAAELSHMAVWLAKVTQEANHFPLDGRFIRDSTAVSARLRKGGIKRKVISPSGSESTSAAKSLCQVERMLKVPRLSALRDRILSRRVWFAPSVFQLHVSFIVSPRPGWSCDMVFVRSTKKHPVPDTFLPSWSFPNTTFPQK